MASRYWRKCNKTLEFKGDCFSLAATSAQVITPVPVHWPDGMITQVAYDCGSGRTLVNGVCVDQNNHPPNPPSRLQVSMAKRRLHSLCTSEMLPNWHLIDTKSDASSASPALMWARHFGAQAGEKRLRKVIGAGGFGNIRRATKTPFNMVLEARP